MSTVSHEDLDAAIAGSERERASVSAEVLSVLSGAQDITSIDALTSSIAARMSPRQPGAQVGEFELSLRQQVSLALADLLKSGQVVFVKKKDNPHGTGCGYRISQ